jgi:organic radical activating enzyme
MFHIPNKVDFYITNVCNLTCQGCNRFNNYDFRGWQRWSDYEPAYRQWSKLIKLRAVTIMGGEPFLNPTLQDWVRGINELFGIEVQVLTNGTRFPYIKNFYNTLLYQSPVNGAQNHIGVSLHNANQYSQLDTDIKNFLQGPVQVYPKTHNLNMYKSDYMYRDKNNVVVNVYIVDKFLNSTIKQVTVVSQRMNKRFELHNSDPIVAHNNCSFAQFKSYHFIKGGLYKCGPVGLLPEFDQQNNIHMRAEDRALINSYRPLNTENFAEYHQEFFANIDNPIPQCKFCPESARVISINPVPKGSINV